MKKKKIWMNKIKEFSDDSLGISKRALSIMHEEVLILYIPELTDRGLLSDHIIKPILQYGKEQTLTIDKILTSVIYVDDIFSDDDEEKILDHLLEGKSIIILLNGEKYIVANTAKVEQRKVQSPEVETTLRGPKDAFTENLDTNLSLIRYRIKDPSLRIDKLVVGKRTKTNTAIVYIKDIANPNYVNEVKKRIQNIHVDGILESGYIQKFILNNSLDFFPQAGIVERSDAACANLLEGKICIIVEGSNLGLVVPKTFIEFLDVAENHYDNLYLSIFSKILTALALSISLTVSSIYIAVVGFHPDILPPQYILSLAIARRTVPFNAMIEALVMEFIAEILREASIRLPQQIGPAIGIVGAIVIGQAAVAAGLVSPLLVIIVSLSMMCSFVAADYTIISPIRILKFLLIFITGGFGLFGFVMGMTIILINLCAQTSFGIPYFTPVAPFHLKDMINYILSDITLAKMRPKFLRTKDQTRQ